MDWHDFLVAFFSQSARILTKSNRKIIMIDEQSLSSSHEEIDFETFGLESPEFAATAENVAHLRAYYRSIQGADLVEIDLLHPQKPADPRDEKTVSSKREDPKLEVDQASKPSTMFPIEVSLTISGITAKPSMNQDEEALCIDPIKLVGFIGVGVFVSGFFLFIRESLLYDSNTPYRYLPAELSTMLGLAFMLGSLFMKLTAETNTNIDALTNPVVKTNDTFRFPRLSNFAGRLLNSVKPETSAIIPERQPLLSPSKSK